MEAPKAIRIDSTTSATPGFKSSFLANSHAGWGKAGCLSSGCHALSHGGPSPAACAVCHGSNGAPPRTLRAQHTVAGADCASCHAARHADLGFSSPGDCTSCHKFDSPPGTCPVTESFDVVVIGAGGGGLSTAAALSRAGKRVVVLEKHNRVGGYMSNFERGGYRFEVSLHAFDGLDSGGPNVPVFQALGIDKKVQPLRGTTMYRSVYPDLDIDVPADVDQYQAKLREWFPAESEGIDRLFADTAVFDTIITRMSEGMSDPSKLPSPAEMDLFFKYANQNLSEFLSAYLHDQRLVQVWTQLAGFAGTEPDQLDAALFIAMWNSYHRHGAFFFKGGSQAVSDAMAEVIKENGGTIKLGTLATRIDVENALATRVQTDADACYGGRYVVSNANAVDTIHQLIGAQVAPRDAARYKPWKVGLSAFVVYLGVDRDYTSYFHDSHEIMVTDSYDPAENFATIAACDADRTPFAIANYTVLDPTTAPPGKNVIEITGQLGYDCGDEWHVSDGFDAYRRYKDDLGAVLVRRAERVLPGLSQHIEYAEVATPITLRNFTLNPRGTIFGWDNIVSQSMTARMAADRLQDVSNVFLASAWAFPGGGQSAVLISGSRAANTILGLDR